MQNKTVEVSGNTYRIDKLDPFQQWDILRKIAPLFPGWLRFLPVYIDFMRDGSDEARSADNMAAFVDGATPLIDALSKIDGASLKELSLVCLLVCSRRRMIQPHEIWDSVVHQNGKQLMFDDLSLMDLLKLNGHVIMENLGSFFPIAEQSTPQASPAR